MSDERLRELERRWNETGAPDDEVAYLLERMRMGDLTRERLELAAYCGHQGARRTLGGGAGPPSGALELAREVPRWGKRASVRAAAAAAEFALGAFGHSSDRELGHLPQDALALVRSWLSNPTANVEARAREVATELRDCRWTRVAPPAPAIALATSSSCLTVWAGDEDWAKRVAETTGMRPGLFGSFPVYLAQAVAYAVEAARQSGTSEADLVGHVMAETATDALRSQPPESP